MLKRGVIFALTMLLTAPAWAATNFLEAPGTNGFIATPFNLQSTELNALASGACATSSVGGTSGVFTQTSNANAIWGEVSFTSGGAFTPVAGQLLNGWFIESNNATNFETSVATCSLTVPPIPRQPDFVIPLSNAAYASGNIALATGRFVMLPWGSYKVIVQNAGGTGGAVTALPATSNLVVLAPAAIQY